MTGLEFIAKQEYPGRGILIGRTLDGKDFVAYFVTGRSPPSRARRFEPDVVEEPPTDATAHAHIGRDNLGVERIKTAPTDPEAIKKGNPALLIYDAVVRCHDALIVSNGAQTGLILYALSEDVNNPAKTPAQTITRAFGMKYDEACIVDGIDLTSFEPDAPNFTPRISGILGRDGGALAICKNNSGRVDRNYFEFPLVPGRARYISTYTGRNVPKGVVIPAFTGEPVELEVSGKTPEDIAKYVYEALGPKTGEGIVSPGDDFRVGVVAAFRPEWDDKLDFYILNRDEKK